MDAPLENFTGASFIFYFDRRAFKYQKNA